MKILGISGSPRKNGITNSVMEKLLKKAEKKGHSAKLIILNDLALKGCMGCGYCRTEGTKCIQTDDIAAVLENIKQADAVIIGSPVYMGNVSGQMKIFIDRLYSLKDSSRSPRLMEKKAILVFAQGAAGKDYYKNVFSQIQKTLSGYNLKVFETIICDNPQWEEDGETAEKISKAEALF